MSLDGVHEMRTKESAPAEGGEFVAPRVDDEPGDRFSADDDGDEDHGHDYGDPDRRRNRRPANSTDPVFCRPLEVVVRDDRVEQAIRQLKNRMAREGVLRELKNRRHYFKPSELKRIKSREAARRRRKQARQKSSH